MGVFKSLKVDKMIRGLSEEQKQAIVDYLREQGASFGALGVPVSSAEEEIRLAVGAVSGDPEDFLRTLISGTS